MEREKQQKVAAGDLCCLCVCQHRGSVQQKFSGGEENQGPGQRS